MVGLGLAKIQQVYILKRSEQEHHRRLLLHRLLAPLLRPVPSLGSQVSIEVSHRTLDQQQVHRQGSSERAL